MSQALAMYNVRCSLLWRCGRSVRGIRLSWQRENHHNQQAQRLACEPCGIGKLLVANRGEIACRIIRTARRLGVRTVAVYSQTDKHAQHVVMADEAVCVGGAAAADSYLRMDRVLRAVRETSATALHPGYGFLSENVQFAKLCQSEGVTFVGPPPSAIRDMGVKSTSKRIMQEAGVPVITGYHGDDQRDSVLLQQAERIGFPVMIKAVMGGGGKGMRIAMNSEQFVDQLQSARREAQQAFGDQAMLIEQYVEKPRHVEVQVFADQHDNCVYLWERDCSVQRRHQKIIEEAPAPALEPDVRRRLGEAAVRAARAVNYVGAGTVEFIVDDQQRFFFMEMNTRLQVEHPVTEMITGLDLVEWQLRVAAGETLPISQQQHIPLHGHSVEARIYAEQPSAEFLPAAGQLRVVRPPTPTSDIRVETGVVSGDEVSVHYDPMIAKLVVWAADRPTALSKLSRCLADYAVVGVETNIGFLIELTTHAEFAAANIDTDFISRHHSQLFPPQQVTDQLLCQATMAVVLSRQRENKGNLSANNSNQLSPFATLTSQRFNHSLSRQMSLVCGAGVTHSLGVQYVSGSRADRFSLTIAGQSREVCASLSPQCLANDDVSILTCDVSGHVTHTPVFVDGDTVHVFTERGVRTLRVPEPDYVRELENRQTSDEAGVMAPMPGVVERLLVDAGAHVKAGQPILVVIAMKMEYVIKAPCDGVVEKFLFKAGDNVAKNCALVAFKTSSTEE